MKCKFVLTNRPQPYTRPPSRLASRLRLDSMVRVSTSRWNHSLSSSHSPCCWPDSSCSGSPKSPIADLPSLSAHRPLPILLLVFCPIQRPKPDARGPTTLTPSLPMYILHALNGSRSRSRAWYRTHPLRRPPTPRVAPLPSP
jgi:hypothetical protein